MVRKFSLTNKNGEIYDFIDPDTFGYNPNGLGVVIGNSFYGYGTDFIPNGSIPNQNVIKMNVLFGAENKDCYVEYNKFINFLSFADDDNPLVFKYSLDKLGTFSRDVRFSELTKSEINQWNVLDEELTLDCLGSWYQWVQGGADFLEFEDIPGDGKIYVNNGLENNQGFYTYGPMSLDASTVENTPIPTITETTRTLYYTYDYYYTPDFGYTKISENYKKHYDVSDVSWKTEMIGYVYETDFTKRESSFIVLNNDSVYLGVDSQAPFEIVITANTEAIHNPEWHLFSGTTEIQNDRYLIDIPIGYSLIISSNPVDQRVNLSTDTGNLSNVYQTQDLTKTNFIRIPKGTLTLVLNGLDSSNVKWRMKKEWVVV